jgi:hypothetical protein
MINALLISIWVSPYTRRISLPNLEELSFLIVFEFPKASRISLQPRIFYSIPKALRLVFLTALSAALRFALFLLLLVEWDSLMSSFMFFPREARNFKQYFVF